MRWAGLFVLLVFAQPLTAGPLGLPDSARPGAVRPEEVGRPVTPPEPAGELMEIPAVIDRPFEIEEGPRVAVLHFRFPDARDLPDVDLRVADLQTLVDGLRDQRPEGFTIGQLQEVADQVTRFYRGKGLILAQAVLPVQQVKEGIVDIQIFEGSLGRVLTEGNQMYDAVVLQGPFKKLIGQPVTKDAIETALLQLTDFPGLTVFGVFQPGQLVGTADIVLRVQEEERFDIAYRVDNHGLQETGRIRFRPTLEWNNPTGTADHIEVSLQQTYRPKNNLYESVDYDRYFGRGVTAGFSGNRNEFDVGGELAARKIKGKTDEVGLWAEKAWFRSRQFNMATNFAFAHKESRTFTAGRQINKDRLSVFSLEASMDQVDSRFKGINFATLEYSHGVKNVAWAMGSSNSAAEQSADSKPSRQGGSGRFASAEFDKVFITGSRLQTLPREFLLLVRGELQWSDSLLVPLEQYSVGGPDNVRAYPAAQILLDRALLMSAELIHGMPFISDVQAFGNRTWGEMLQFSVFYDHAIGRLNDPLESEPNRHVNFRGAGVQARFTLPGTIESRLIWAWQFGRNLPDNEREPQLWGDLTYRF